MLELIIPKNSTVGSISIGLNLRILETLNPPLSLSTEVDRCTSDLKTCEKFYSGNTKKLCAKLKNPNSLVTKLTETIEPRLKCPIEPGNYSTKPFDMDI
jgi:hypothetical protein